MERTPDRPLRTEVAAYIGLTLVVSSVFYVLIARRGIATAGGSLLVAGLMWTPGIVALGSQLWFRRTLRGLGWRVGRGRYWLIGYMVPILYAVPTYLLIWSSPLAEMDGSVFERLGARWHLLILGTLQSCLFALGEELGWRGYLVPRLARLHGFDRTALISGLVWAVWHYPLILFGGYTGGAPLAYSIFWFTVMVIGISFFYTWITLQSGSVWPAMLLHGSHNLYIQGVLDRATIDTGPTEYWTGEFGAGLALAAAVVALVSRRLARALPYDRI